MGWTTKQISLATLMLITGSINTLSTKWADTSVAVGEDGSKRVFDHPFLQAVGMFLGELSCLVVFKLMLCYRRQKRQVVDIGPQTFSPFIFMPAAMCDMCGTSIMYIGLNMTYASSFQMLRGAVMIFTALLSVAFLGRTIKSRMWIGMITVVGGLVLVGVADVAFPPPGQSSKDQTSIITGDLLIVIAQIVVAFQMVYEEKFVNRHNVPPMQAVGWEGFFGFTVLGLLLIPMYFIKAGKPFSNDPEGRLENVPDAFVQMGNNWQIIVATVGNIVSIAFFNFAGISVTVEMSATTRMVLDSCRTLIIWIVSLAVGWQAFIVQAFFVQLAGFVLLILGMCIYNDLVFAPFMRSRGWLAPNEEEIPAVRSHTPNIQDDENEPLLSNAADPRPARSRYDTEPPTENYS